LIHAPSDEKTYTIARRKMEKEEISYVKEEGLDTDCSSEMRNT
jgi:hypothetical protein